MEDDTSMLNTQETAQQPLVYITNLENELQNHGTKVNKEEGPKDKKPAARIGLLKGPPELILITVPKMDEESGSENDNIEENEKGKE